MGYSVRNILCICAVWITSITAQSPSESCYWTSTVLYGDPGTWVSYTNMAPSTTSSLISTTISANTSTSVTQTSPTSSYSTITMSTSIPNTPLEPLYITVFVPGSKNRKRALKYVAFDGDLSILVDTKEEAAVFTITADGKLMSGGQYVGTSTTGGTAALQKFNAPPEANFSWSNNGTSISFGEAKFCYTSSGQFFVVYGDEPTQGCSEAALAPEPAPIPDSQTTTNVSSILASPTSSTSSVPTISMIASTSTTSESAFPTRSSDVLSTHDEETVQPTKSEPTIMTSNEQTTVVPMTSSNVPEDSSSMSNSIVSLPPHSSLLSMSESTMLPPMPSTTTAMASAITTTISTSSTMAMTMKATSNTISVVVTASISPVGILSTTATMKSVDTSSSDGPLVSSKNPMSITVSTTTSRKSSDSSTSSPITSISTITTSTFKPSIMISESISVVVSLNSTPTPAMSATTSTINTAWTSSTSIILSLVSPTTSSSSSTNSSVIVSLSITKSLSTSLLIISSASSISSIRTSSSSKTTTTTSTSSTSPSPSMIGPLYYPAKRGISYNNVNTTHFYSPPTHVSWAYNWYSLPNNSNNNINVGTFPYSPSGYPLKFIPTLYSGNPSLTSIWSANVNYSIANYGTDIIFAFNEPDACFQGQSACMSVAAAIDGYQKYIQPFAGIVKIGAPAVTNAAEGLSYLKQFMGNATLLNLRVDFVNIHWYASPYNMDYFISYLTQARDIAGPNRTVWVTEYGMDKDNYYAPHVELFLKNTTYWCDQQDWIEGYAWFGNFKGKLLNANATGLSELGSVWSNYTGTGYTKI